MLKGVLKTRYLPLLVLALLLLFLRSRYTHLHTTRSSRNSLYQDDIKQRDVHNNETDPENLDKDINNSDKGLEKSDKKSAKLKKYPNLRNKYHDKSNNNDTDNDSKKPNTDSENSDTESADSDTISYNPDTDPYNADAEQQLRLQTVARVCSRPYLWEGRLYPSMWTRNEQHSYHMLAYDEVFLKHVLVDNKHKIMYCYLPKVSCTNWKRLMVVLASRSKRPIMNIPRASVNSRVGLTSLRDMKYPAIVNILTNYTKFVFVRDPLERVLSAYIDKFVKHSASAGRMGRKEGVRFQMMYRENAGDISHSGKNTTFEEFARYIVDTTLSGTEDMNDHWETMTRLCQPCLVRYDFIGKFEHIGEDSALLLSRINAPANVSYPPVVESHTSTAIQHYMAQLSGAVREELLGVYARDTEVFGYKSKTFQSNGT